MSGLREAIEDFRASLAQVYEVQPDRIIRDANAARRSAKDYTGRWFFELVQNCEDAHASAVVVKITDDAVCVADNGDGFRPGAVESISGTDFSDKPVGAIGRKGVGFKAVYEIAATPQLFTLNGDGLEFDPARAAQWLRQNGIECPEDRQPYQWIPFFLSRREAEQRDAALINLCKYSTVVRLPFKSEKGRELATKHLGEWPSYALLPFEHVNTVRVTGVEMPFETSVERDHDCWVLRDSRQAGRTVWRALRRSCSPPTNCLADLDPDDRERVQQVGFLVAAPIGLDGAVRPADDPMPVHVFYPTEETAPIRMLLHAEFLVKTDRTRVLPIEDSPFNAWVAEELAKNVVDLVNAAHAPEQPATAVSLLEPVESIDQLPLAAALWARIARQANANLMLPDMDGEPKLALGKALSLAVTVARSEARTILAATPLAHRLVHESIDRDPHAMKALQALGCDEMTDEHLLEVIKHHAVANAGSIEWLWACWQWLASYLSACYEGSDEWEERREKARALPVVPVDGTIRSAQDTAHLIVTWRESTVYGRLPGWLPLAFVPDWLGSHITATEDGDPVRQLARELGVAGPGDTVVIRALEKSISDYWDQPNGDPSRFVRLIWQHRWHRQYDPSDGMARCPVVADVVGEEDQRYVEAGEAYFGRDWGETRLADLYDGVAGVAWAVRPPSDADEYREVLEWLGVQAWPRIVRRKVKKVQVAERKRVRPLVGRYYSSVTVTRATPLALDRIAPKDLANRRAVALIALLARNWLRYFKRFSQVEVEYTPRSRTYSESVPSLWWEQVNEQLRPPIVQSYAESAPLAKCWLPDKATDRSIGELIAVIDLAAFEGDADETREWLNRIVPVRKTLDEIPLEEWRNLLSSRIVSAMPTGKMADDPGMRDIVVRWYEASLESLDEQEHIPDGALADVPILSRKGDEWDYVDAAQVWLADDEQLASAFRDDCWQAEIRSVLRSQATRFFGLSVLSEAVKREFLSGPPVKQESEQLQASLDQVRPYVFAWRCSQTKREPEKIRHDLLSLRAVAVDGLRVRLTLPDVTRKEIDTEWGIYNGELLLNTADWDRRLPFLGRLLAEALQVKTDANLYENLLRCGSDAERQGKLVSEGVMREELDRLLRLFSREPEPEIPQEPKQPFEPQDAEAVAQGPPEDTGGPAETADAEGEEEITTPDEETAVEELELREPQEEEIVIGAGLDSRTGGGGGGGHPGSQGGGQLTQEQKDEIERCARRAAMKQLRDMGYQVEEMPQMNPGFDIKAARENDELRVEVKGHRRTATVVDLTTRELEEYYKAQSGGAVRWELWNVENLSRAAPGLITVTRYEAIPEEAIRSRTLAVDLVRCTVVSSDSSK